MSPEQALPSEARLLTLHLGILGRGYSTTKFTHSLLQKDLRQGPYF